MSYPKMANLVLSLLRQTNNGKLGWDQTEKVDVFQASFPRYSVRIYTEQKSPFQMDYIIQIINDMGEIIEEVADTELNSVMDDAYRDMKDLFESARRNAMGVEQALDDLLDFLHPPFDDLL